MSNTFADNVSDSVKAERPELGENMVKAFTMLAMADFRKKAELLLSKRIG